MNAFSKLFGYFRFIECYGTLGILDRIHGTNTMFKNNEAFNRHYILHDLVSAREKYPDVDKKED